MRPQCNCVYIGGSLMNADVAKQVICVLDVISHRNFVHTFAKSTHSTPSHSQSKAHPKHTN